MNVPTGYNDSPGAYLRRRRRARPGRRRFRRALWLVRRICSPRHQPELDPDHHRSRRALRAPRQDHCLLPHLSQRLLNNIRLETSSGNRSMDDSATRALLSIDKLPALPSDYSGAYVDVTFDFDLSLTK